MPRSGFDQQEISLQCRSCNARTTRKLVWLRVNNQYDCATCGSIVDVDSQKIISGLERAQKYFEDFKKSLTTH